MTIFGNILLVIAGLFFMALVSLLFGKVPPRGGDAVIGFTWAIIIYHLLFFAVMTFLFIIIASKGGFDWISAQRPTRYLIIGVGLTAAVLTSALSGLFKYENGPVPALLRLFSGFVPILIPLILILSAAVLLNNGIKDMVPMALIKWPLIFVAVVGLAGILSGMYGWISASNRNAMVQAESSIRRQDENHLRMLQEIESCDVTKDMVFILVMTDANQDPDVRDKAVAKVKTNLKWQQELIRLLESDWAPEAFNFLASNDVDDKSLFPDAVKLGVLNQARLIRENLRSISHESHLYPEKFAWETERVLRTVDKFEGMGRDYRPAVKELRLALDEPIEFEKPVLNCVSMLDRWLAKHR
jgi:hypothetical protein